MYLETVLRPYAALALELASNAQPASEQTSYSPIEARRFGRVSLRDEEFILLACRMVENRGIEIENSLLPGLKLRTASGQFDRQTHNGIQKQNQTPQPRPVGWR